MSTDNPRRPKLLVSVRNLAEARDALAGGCDILDVKEPANGSLGMADAGVIREIVTAGTADRTQGFPKIPGFFPPTPISAALGETRDWRDQTSVPILPRGLSYAKLGTAGLSDRPHWEQEWRSVRARFDAVAESPVQWVAVAYADWERAAAPPPNEILRAAATSGCEGILIDTFRKDGRTLFDALSFDAIGELMNAVRRTPLFVALAGSLSLGDVATAVELRPDVIAVRSAACRNGNRNAAVCRESVVRLRETLSSRSSNP